MRLRKIFKVTDVVIYKIKNLKLGEDKGWELMEAVDGDNHDFEVWQWRLAEI